MAQCKEIADLLDLSGKTAIVTGGARGIGEGIATRLAQAGAKVAILDINGEALDETAKKLKGQGLEVAGVRADVTAEADCAAAVRKTVDLYGGLDILVNNAAYFPTIPLMQMSREDWDKIYAINCRGAFLMTKETVGVMMRQNETAPDRGGVVIFISSTGAYRANRVGMSAYHSTKGALLSFKNHLTGELAPHGIRVNCVVPGSVNSFNADADGVYRPFPMDINQIPLRRSGTPYDIANAVLFLSSPSASYITGIELPVEGGMTRLPTFGYPEEQLVQRSNG
jgi:NAD(P)-dependent dehydrogenase (short-subunit alcohol dehydrogenase family)